MQIRTRLTLQFIVLVAGILVLTLSLIYYEFRKMTEAEFYDALRSKALMTAEMVLEKEQDLSPLEFSSAQAVAESPLPFKENVVIFNAQLQKVFAFDRYNEPIDAHRLLQIKPSDELRQRDGNRFSIAVTRTAKSGQQYFIMAESLFFSAEMDRLRNVLSLSFFLCIGIVALGGWFYAGQAMHPVTRINNQVDSISPSDLGSRLQSPNQHDEMGRLIGTFNRLLDRIQHAFQMQKGFISNVSHELKNPLSAIISQLEVSLSRRDRKPEEYHETLHSVLEDTREMSNVIEKLLEFARVHADSSNIPFETVRLDELILQTRASLLRQHPEYQIAFDIAGTIPEEETDLCIRGNELLLRSAFQNLMDNGCKYSPDKRVEVTLEFEPTGEHHINIRDKGPGIPASEHEKIFKPFFRHSQTLHIQGTGIGLSLVNSILQLHKVSIRLDSAPGKGSTFVLQFPTNPSNNLAIA
jgi:signal transduction histidine kinase